MDPAARPLRRGATPPATEAELLGRLARIAGQPLSALAREVGFELPADPRRAKGAVGQLVERVLGASAGSRAEPDFPGLGIELKTLPIDPAGRPGESTFVASLDLAAADRRWEVSAVRKKLRRVCWLLVEAGHVPLAERRCGVSLLWSPSEADEQRLRRDYEDIVALLDEGARVTAHAGEALQLRPKGRDGRALRRALDPEGATVRAAPRAFYLRPSFTAELLRRHFG